MLEKIPRAETVKILSTNDFMERCRADYRKSSAFKAIEEGTPLPRTTAAILDAAPMAEPPQSVREPGADDEYAILQQNLADLANP